MNHSTLIQQSVGKSPRHSQNPLLGEWRKHCQNHHALSPGEPPRHHLYTIHPINGLHCFYHITIIMSLK